MSNIREVQFAKPQTDDGVIRTLEEWLKRAKDGEIQAVGIAGVKPDGCISTEWSGLSSGWLHQLNSALSILQHRVLINNVEQD